MNICTEGYFEVYTDNNPLTYILTTVKLDVTGQRWVASLANYNFKIFYKSGKLNVDADALSQIPWENMTGGPHGTSNSKGHVTIKISHMSVDIPEVYPPLEVVQKSLFVDSSPKLS